MKILCVDDEVCILKSLSRMLQIAGYATLSAISARAGLEILAVDRSIALVISDYRMPQISGVTFLREVRRNWPETGRILLTGHADEQEVSQAVSDGVIQRLIAKPWQDEKLLASLCQIIGPPAPGGFFHFSV